MELKRIKSKTEWIAKNSLNEEYKDEENPYKRIFCRSEAEAEGSPGMSRIKRISSQNVLPLDKR